MKTKLKSFVTWKSFFSMCGVVVLCPRAPADDWWFELGPAVRTDMKLSVSGSSYAQELGLHSPGATGPLAAPAGIGPLNAYANRNYTNSALGGYVNLDPGTGNPASLDPNTTWNWGFNNSAQYNAAAQTLTYQSTGLPGYTTLRNSPASGSDNFLGTGLQFVIGHPLMQSGKWSLDVFFKFQGIWGQDQHFSISPYAENVRQITATDTYDVSGIGAGNFPTSYQGTYLGPFGTQSPPYPVIPNLPESRSWGTNTLSTSSDNINFDVHEASYDLGVGPQIGYQAAKRLSLHLRPSISLDLLDVDVQRTESFAGTVWSDHSSKFGALLGLGITGGVDFELGHGFYLGVNGGYDFVPDNFDVPVGPNTLKLNPSGWEVSPVLGLRF